MRFKLLSNEKRQVSLNMDAINAYTARYKPHTPFDFEIVRRVAKQSDSQRAFYFSKVVPIYAEALGYEPDEYYIFHVHLKFRYFEGYYSGEPTKKPYLDALNVPRNVPPVFADDSEFDVAFKAKFIDWVVRRAGHDGVYIDVD